MNLNRCMGNFPGNEKLEEKAQVQNVKLSCDVCLIRIRNG